MYKKQNEIAARRNFLKKTAFSCLTFPFGISGVAAYISSLDSLLLSDTLPEKHLELTVINDRLIQVIDDSKSYDYYANSIYSKMFCIEWPTADKCNDQLPYNRIKSNEIRLCN